MSHRSILTNLNRSHGGDCRLVDEFLDPTREQRESPPVMKETMRGISNQNFTFFPSELDFLIYFCLKN